MRTTCPVIVPAVVAALAVAALTAVPVLAADPASAAAAEHSRTAGTDRAARVDFTAGVRSIAHGPGVVTVTGTVPTGESVEVGGDVLEPVWAEGDLDGHWEARVRVRPGEHVIRVTSQVTGQSVDLPVEMLILLPPDVLATVDGIGRTIDLDGTGHPGARMVLKVDGAPATETDVHEDGTWHVLLRDLSFGRHHVEAAQYFDGTQNGGVDDVYELSGAPTVAHAVASRQTDRISLDGRAPAGSTVTVEDARGPVTGADGEPVVVHVGDDTSWRTDLPVPDGVRFDVLTVIAHDGTDELGRTEARVTIPLALTGTVEELADGRIRLSGTGEVGGTVTLEDDAGTTLTDAAGEPLRTRIGRSWELVVPRDDLPAGTVVARQRVHDVEQGGLRLVLPALPSRPGPGDGGGIGGGGEAGGAGTGGGTGTSPGSGAVGPTGGSVLLGGEAPRPSVARLRTTDGRVASGRLAYTGTEVARPAVAALAMVALGVAALPLAGVLRRRAAGRR